MVFFFFIIALLKGMCMIEFYHIMMHWRTEMSKLSRNYGIDLLRVFSIFGVVVLHILGHGGILSSATSYGNYCAAYFLEILAYPAVNCFVLISGFVGYRGEKAAPKLQNIISIFFTVLFYSAGICILLQLITPSFVTLTDIKDSFFPLLTDQYWFYGCYLGVFLLSPIANTFVYKASAKQLYLSFIVVLFFSFVALETHAFVLNDGYSVIWFFFLYIAGAAVKKCNIVSKVSGKLCVLTLLAAFLITWLPTVVFPLTGCAFLLEYATYFVSYDSPTVLLMAVAWVCLFAKHKTCKLEQGVISFFSSSAFSVYLIHDNNHIRNLLMLGRFCFANEYHPILLALIVAGGAAAVLVICTLIDKIRIFLFRIIKIAPLSEFIENTVKAVIDKGYCIISSWQENAAE